MTDRYPRWIATAGFYLMSGRRTYHGTASLLSAPARIEQTVNCHHGHRSLASAKRCGETMASRRGGMGRTVTVGGHVRTAPA